jgi:hypothetical protein
MFWSVGEVEMDPLTHSLPHSLHAKSPEGDEASLHAKSPEEAAYTDPLRIGEGGLSLHGADEDFFGSTSTVTQRGEGQQATQIAVRRPVDRGRGRRRFWGVNAINGRFHVAMPGRLDGVCSPTLSVCISVVWLTDPLSLCVCIVCVWLC